MPHTAPVPRTTPTGRRQALRTLAGMALPLGSLGLLAGCATEPQAPAPAESTVFIELAGEGPRLDARAESAKLIAMSEPMQAFIEDKVRPAIRRLGAQRALIQALFIQGRMLLDYDAQITRSAADTFDERRGNCLSLVLMTTAMANALNMPVNYQEVMGVETQEVRQGMTFVVGHLNVVLEPPPRPDMMARVEPAHAYVGELVVDFLPGQVLGRQWVRHLSWERVAAMAFNNRAAEAMERRQPLAAHRWLRAAYALDATFSPIYNTLGVLYEQMGRRDAAIAALAEARRMEPKNPHVQSNLQLLQAPTTGSATAATAPGASAPPRPQVTAELSKKLKLLKLQKQN